MKAPHPITCVGPAALLFFIAACQTPGPDTEQSAEVPLTEAPVSSSAPETALAGDPKPQPVAQTASPMDGSTEPQGPSEPSAKGSSGVAKRKDAAQGGSSQQAKKPKPKPKALTAEGLTKQLKTAKEEKVAAAQEDRYAEAELEIAEMGATGTEIDVVESLRSARADLESAQESLARFEGKERPIKVAKAELSIADAEERLVTAETDLKGLEDIFAEEDEASSKEEILRRGRRKVARAKRSLNMAAQEAAMTIEDELPARLKELTGKVRAQEAALGSAQIAAAKKRRSAELSVEKATDEADAKKRAARKAAAKVSSLQKRVNDARQKGQEGNKKAPKKK